MAGEQQDLPAKESPSAALGNRAYEKELKLQRRIAHQGLKVCIAFEGLDGAGKGGTIKAITEREKSQMYVPCYTGYRPSAGGGRKNRFTYVSVYSPVAVSAAKQRQRK